MKNAFDVLIRRLDTVKGRRTSEPEDMLTKTSQTEKQREKRMGEKRKEKNFQELSGH